MSSPSPAERLNNLPPYVFVAIGARIRELDAQGADVVRLDIGSPDLPPPDSIIDALADSARKPNKHGYSGYKGTPEFRSAMARYYQQRFGVEINPEKEVLPLLGSKEGLVNFSLAYLDRGDLVLVPELGYPSYSMGARMAGADEYFMPMNAENGFLPVFEDIPADVAQKAKVMWLSYPNNPTGVVADLDYYKKAVEFCAANNILLASDNPYFDVTYGDYVGISALQVPGAIEHTVEFTSFSKTFNMAGWRLGAAVGSAEALGHLLSIKSNMDSGHFKSIYDAGVVAIDTIDREWIVERNKIYEERRDAIINFLPEIGLKAETPSAALYIWAEVVGGNGDDYARDALEIAHVSMAPGSAYGPSGKNFVRMSLCTPVERIKEGVERLKAWRSQS